VFTVAKAMAQSKSRRDVALPPNTAKPLRPHRIRLFALPVMVFLFSALLAAFGINRLEPIERPKPHPQTAGALGDPQPPKQQGESSIETTSSGEALPEQFKAARRIGFFVLDVAKTYLALSDAKQADAQRRQRNSQ
jgi:hypothetical protein